MAGSSGGSLVARGYVQLRADSSRLQGDLRNATSMFRAHLANMGDVAGGILAAAGIRGFMGMIHEVGSSFMFASTSMEDFTITLGVLLKSKDAAKALMLQLEEMAAITPYTTNQLAKAATTLKVMGFAASDLIPVLKVIGDAAAASPLGLEEGTQRIAYAFGQIKSTGKLMSRELRMLALAGIPVWDILSEKSHKTVERLRSDIRKGQVDAATGLKMLMEGMSERTGGTMEARSKTWSALISTLTDNVRIFLRRRGEAVFNTLKGGLKGLVDLTDVKSIEPIIDKIRAGFERLVELVQIGSKSPWMPIVRNIASAAMKASSLAGSIGVGRRRHAAINARCNPLPDGTARLRRYSRFLCLPRST